MGGSWCVLLWFHRSFSCSAAMAGGVPSSITVFKGGGEGGRSRSSKSLLRESSGQLVLMETILVLLPMCLYGLGVCRSRWGLCQVHQQCQQGHLTSGRSTQEQPDSAALSACPCRAGVLLSLFRLETLKMTPSSSPQSPQLSWAALGRVVPVDAGRVPRAAPLSEHQGHRNCCPLPAVMLGEGWWPWQLPAGCHLPQGCFLGTGASVTGGDKCQCVRARAAGSWFCSARTTLLSLLSAG